MFFLTYLLLFPVSFFLTSSFMVNIKSKSSMWSESLEESLSSSSSNLNTLSPRLKRTLFLGFLSGDLSSPRVLAVACFDPSSINFLFRKFTRKSFFSSKEPLFTSSSMVLFMSIPVPSSSSLSSFASFAIIDLARSFAQSCTNSLLSLLIRHLETIFSRCSSLNFGHNFLPFIVLRILRASVDILILSEISFALGMLNNFEKRSLSKLIPRMYSACI